MSTVWIAEKPALGKAIANGLGIVEKNQNYIKCKNNNIVTWCYGHILKTVPPEQYDESYKQFKIEDLPLKFHPIKYMPIPDKKDQVNVISNLLKNASAVVHGGDIDDEGQYLVDEVLQYLNWNGITKRVLIDDVSEKAVKKAIENLKDNSDFQGQSKMAYARSCADLIYGLSMTRYITTKARESGYVGNALSIGRVQTPTLALITNRYLQNKNHKENYFYELLLSSLGDDAIAFKSTLINNKDEFVLDEKGRLINKNQLEEVQQNINSFALVKEIKKEVKEESAPLPFNLARLQQYANNKFSYTADQTLKATQSLRENHACITYNRSDCSYLSEEQYLESNGLIQKLKMIDDYKNIDFDSSIKSKAFNNKNITAHTAIIPTEKTPNLSSLSDIEKNIYLAICDYYLAQFLPVKEINVISGILDVNGYEFKFNKKRIKSDGFSSFLQSIDDDKDESENDDLSNEYDALINVSENDELNILNSEIIAKKTSPPKLFTESTLISAMTRIADYIANPEIKKILKEKDKDKKDEHGSIGTSATRSAIIENLKKTEYITTSKKNLVPTEKAIKLIESLPKIITNPDLTALWFSKQKEIEKGDLTVDEFINDLYVDIEEMMNDSNSVPFDSLVDDKCPICNSGFGISEKLGICGKCDFKIWRTIAGKNISEDQIKEIITKGKSKLIKGFTSKSNKKFDAYLVLDKENKGIKFEFENQANSDSKPNNDKCPICSESFDIKEKLGVCGKCDFKIWRTIANKKIEDSQMRNIIKKGKSNLIKGFSNKDGKKFDAYLVLDKENKGIKFEFEKKNKTD